MPSPLSWLDSLQGSGIRPGLGRIRALLRSLGRPERRYPSIVVAGTNGKGSTSAMLASILCESGYRIGFYTSPHLVELRERWRVDGAMIDPALLDDCIERLQRAARRTSITPTYFEALTIIAFAAFAAAECDIAVLEVGMGGRLDATNVVLPMAAVITPIDIDHTEYLGTTIRKIAAEKAGIIHRGAIVLTSNGDPIILDVLRRRAEHFGNRFIVVTEEHETPLAGGFQRKNAGLAVRTARELVPLLPKITEESIERGVTQTRWRGRLERIDYHGKEVWIDGCHNAHAARTIAPFLNAHVPRPRLLVFGIMADKDVENVARTLYPLFDAIVATEPYPPRSAPASRLVGLANAMDIPSFADPDPRNAFLRAMASAARGVVVAGSLYLAGAAIEWFDEKKQQP